VVVWNNQSVWLPDGIQFYTKTVASPAPPVQQPTWSYYYSNQLMTLGPGQTPVYWYSEQCYPVNSQEDIEWAKHPTCTPGIKYSTGEVVQLPSGTVFFQNAATTVAIPPAAGSYVYPTPPPFPSPNVGSIITTAVPPSLIPNTLPVPPPTLPTPPTVPVPPHMLPTIPTVSVPPPTIPTTPTLRVPPPTLPTKQKPKKCSVCGEMKPLYFTICSSSICHQCAFTKLSEGRLSSIHDGAETPWTGQVIFDLYSSISKLPDEALRVGLPPTIPLPLDSFVCVARNEACAVGYPAEGHFAGLSAKVAEGGCPNGHAICKGCATKLTTCPKCKSFVPYLELPLGCPACPGDYKHCANFEKACNVPGCTGGTWPPKARPEEAKVEEPKVQPPAEEAKGEPPAVEEPPKQKAEVKVEEQPPTV